MQAEEDSSFTSFLDSGIFSGGLTNEIPKVRDPLTVGLNNKDKKVYLYQNENCDFMILI